MDVTHFNKPMFGVHHLTDNSQRHGSSDAEPTGLYLYIVLVSFIYAWQRRLSEVFNLKHISAS